MTNAPEDPSPDSNSSYDSSSSCPYAKNIDQDARNIMGNVLIRFFEGELGREWDANSSSDSKVYTVTKTEAEIIKKLGLYLFLIVPSKCRGYSDKSRMVKTRLESPLNQELKKELITTIWGDYALETDLGKKILDTRDLANLIESVPEFKSLHKNLVNVSDTTEIRRATLDPYLIIMGMLDSNRPLATIAISKASQSDKMSYAPIDVQNKDIYRLRECIERLMPNAEDFIEAAKEYGLKEIIPVMTDFRNSLEQYTTVWCDT